MMSLVSCELSPRSCSGGGVEVYFNLRILCGLLVNPLFWYIIPDLDFSLGGVFRACLSAHMRSWLLPIVLREQ